MDIKSQSRYTLTPSKLFIYNLNHLFSDFDSVYEPAEDSFILLDALELELEEIRKIKPIVALEVGPGSGIISAALANLTVNQNSHKKLCFVFACDINLSACSATKRTGLQNNVSGNLEVLRCNLMENIKDRLNHQIDLGMFKSVKPMKRGAISFSSNTSKGH